MKTRIYAYLFYPRMIIHLNLQILMNIKLISADVLEILADIKRKRIKIQNWSAFFDSMIISSSQYILFSNIDIIFGSSFK